jgi:hypothetical protein
MILDCSEEESMHIQDYISARIESAAILHSYYSIIHYSTNRIIKEDVCCATHDVKNGLLEDGQHNHFMDGGDGGYALY